MYWLFIYASKYILKDHHCLNMVRISDLLQKKTEYFDWPSET